MFTKPQIISLYRLYNRFPIYVKDKYTNGSNPINDAQSPITFDEFINDWITLNNTTVFVNWCHTILGIESNGHTHS